MNVKTAKQYERIGEVLQLLRRSKKLSPMEHGLIEYILNDTPFQNAIAILRELQKLEDGELMTLNDLSLNVGLSYESTKVIIRSLRVGGFEFIVEESGRGKEIALGVELKQSTLIHLMDLTSDRPQTAYERLKRHREKKKKNN